MADTLRRLPTWAPYIIVGVPVAGLIWFFAKKAKAAVPGAPPPGPAAAKLAVLDEYAAAANRPPITTAAYTLTRGDTFSAVAKRAWGDMALWPAVWDANKMLAPTEESLTRLPVGAVVAIPPRPTGAYENQVRARAAEYARRWAVVRADLAAAARREYAGAAKTR